MTNLTASDVRTWATAEGYKVPSKGRLTNDIKVAYLKGHPALARKIANEKGIPVGVRGRMPADLFEALV